MKTIFRVGGDILHKMAKGALNENIRTVPFHEMDTHRSTQEWSLLLKNNVSDVSRAHNSAMHYLFTGNCNRITQYQEV